jgi:hypothetical protein
MAVGKAKSVIAIDDIKNIAMTEVIDFLFSISISIFSYSFYGTAKGYLKLAKIFLLCLLPVKKQ